MKIAVLVKQVPDLVEGLEIAASGKALDPDSLRFILSESDDHALEEALLLKERAGGRVEVFALDTAEATETLVAAIAKGADRAVLIRTGLDSSPDNHTAARIFAGVVKDASYDLVLAGVRAIDDLDGSLGGLLAGMLNLPYAGLVRKVEVPTGEGALVVQKEYPGGAVAELEVKLPAVLGIQAAEQPPRYVPISRLRQVMMTAKAEEVSATVPAATPLPIERLYKPEEGAGAMIFPGTPEEVAQKIAGVLVERHLVR